MNFSMITLNQSTRTEQNYATRILTALLFMSKPKIFIKAFADYVKKWFDSSNYEDKRLLPIGESEKNIGVFKDELGGKILKEIVALGAKVSAYLMDGDTEHKKAKETKKCIIKRELMFKNYKDYLFNDKIILKTQQRFKSGHHSV